MAIFLNEKYRIKEKWDNLVAFVSKEFGDGEKLDLQAILFLIGIQELGKGTESSPKKKKWICFTLQYASF